MVGLLERYAAQNLEQPFSEQDPFTVERYRQFHGFMPRGAEDILDVGANTGRGGETLHELNPNYRICGLDCVQARVDALPACYVGAVCGLSTSIPADDKSFDVILAGEFVEHLYPADVDPTLCEFQRLLKVGGRLMMTTPNPNSLLLWLKGRTVYTVSHETQHYACVLKWRLKTHGFSRVRIYGSGKLTQYLGSYVPVLPLYGSYLIIADKR